MAEELGMPAGSLVKSDAILQFRGKQAAAQAQRDIETQRQQRRITIQDMRDQNNLTLGQQRTAAAYERLTRGGSFTPLVDENGLVTGAWNAKTNEFRALPQELEGASKTALPPTENLRRATAQTVLDQLDEIETLATKNPGAIGADCGAD